MEPQSTVGLSAVQEKRDADIRQMAGNHDEPDGLRAAFPKHSYLRQRSGHLDYVIDDHALRIVALDSTVPRKPGGALRDSQLAWLDETLAAARAKPTIVALHHPPFWTGIVMALPARQGRRALALLSSRSRACPLPVRSARPHRLLKTIRTRERRLSLGHTAVACSAAPSCFHRPR